MKENLVQIFASVLGVIFLGWLSWGSLKIIELEGRLTKLEVKFDLSNTAQSKVKEPNKVITPTKPDDRDKKVYPLTTLNMNEDQQLEGIEIVSNFHIEWDTGPASKVFQVYLNGKLVKEQRVRNGELVSLGNEIGGQCEFKTWWDDGSRKREEIWVYVVSK